jgi:hypothetical protein
VALPPLRAARPTHDSTGFHSNIRRCPTRRHALLIAGEITGCRAALLGVLPRAPRVGVWRLRRCQVGQPISAAETKTSESIWERIGGISSSRDLIAPPHHSRCEEPRIGLTSSIHLETPRQPLQALAVHAITEKAPRVAGLSLGGTSHKDEVDYGSISLVTGSVINRIVPNEVIRRAIFIPVRKQTPIGVHPLPRADRAGTGPCRSGSTCRDTFHLRRRSNIDLPCRPAPFRMPVAG